MRCSLRTRRRSTPSHRLRKTARARGSRDCVAGVTDLGCSSMAGGPGASASCPGVRFGAGSLRRMFAFGPRWICVVPTVRGARRAPRWLHSARQRDPTSTRPACHSAHGGTGEIDPGFQPSSSFWSAKPPSPRGGRCFSSRGRGCRRSAFCHRRRPWLVRWLRQFPATPRYPSLKRGTRGASTHAGDRGAPGPPWNTLGRSTRRRVDRLRARRPCNRVAGLRTWW